MDNNDKIKLARIDERVDSIDKSFDDHEEHDADRFERTFEFVKEGFDKIDDRFDKITIKIDALWDTKNQQTGAWGLGKYIAGAIGGCIVAVIDYIGYGGHIK